MAEAFTMTERTGFGLATVMARKGVDPRLVEAALPDMRLLPTGPGTWLALADAPDEGLAARLEGLASVSDQSGGYVLYRIEGPQARALLQRGVFIDLDARVFVPGSVSVTMIAHMGVVLWRPEGADAPDVFELALFRSFAQSFRHWVDATARGL